MRIAAIDQGTTSTRVLVFDENEPPRVALSLRHRQIYPHPGWVEHDPNELLANVAACVAAAGPVDSLGFANQGESCLAWDAQTGAPLSPVIVWQDNRTQDAVARLAAAGREPDVRARTGLPLDCYFSASKLAWILEHCPDAEAARRAGRLRLGTTDSFFLDRLAGTFATDVTTASRTSLMNLATLAWDESLCAAFGIPPEALAPIRPTRGDFGSVGAIRVTASVVDQQAALYGHGCRRPGECKITFGTGAFALAISGSTPAVPEAGLLSTVAWRIGDATTYAVEGGVYDVGAALEWAMRLGLLRSHDELQSFAGPSALERGLVFVPALSGLACPQWDRDASGLWIGMTTATSREDLLQAMLEGIALQTLQVVRAMDGVAGAGRTLSVDGGVTASPYFLQTLADLTQRTVVRRGNAELTASGCAALAGWTGAPAVQPADVGFEPRRVMPGVALYDEALARSAGWRAAAMPRP